MRRLSIAVTLTMLLFYSSNAQQKTDREKADLLGPVRSVRSTTTEYKDATLKVSLETKERYTITYDEKGNQLEHIIEEFYGMPGGKDIRKYDSKGILNEILVFNSEGLHERQVHAFENGKLMSIIYYDPKGKETISEINSYGEGGLLLQTKYIEKKKAFGKTVYKYDEKGNLTDAGYYDMNGAKSFALLGPCRGAHRVTYAYNEQRKQTKIVFYELDERVKDAFQYSYDAKGLVTTHILQYYDVKQAFAYSYEFDSHGNWIRKVTTKDLGNNDFPDASKQVSVTSRQISYYEN